MYLQMFILLDLKRLLQISMIGFDLLLHLLVIAETISLQNRFLKQQNLFDLFVNELS